MAGYPVFRLAGTPVANTGVNTVAWPSHATNDVALLIVQTEAQASSLVTSAGFVEVPGSPQTTGTAAATNAVALQVFWKRATGTAEASVTLADAGDHTYARILTFTNVKTSGDPWNAIGGGVKAAASTNLQITGVTTTTADCLIVAIAAGSVDTTTAQASTWTNAALGALAEIADTASTTGGGGSLSAGAGTLHLKGASGTTTVTLASESKNAFITIALAPIEPSGSIAMAAPVCTITATGVVTGPAITGTGALTAPAPSIAATGTNTGPVVTVTGSGTAAFATPTISATGNSLNTGTASVASPPLTLAGTATQTDTGTAALAFASPTLSATGTQTDTGNAALAAPALTLAADGTVGAATLTGSGAVAFAGPVLDATGTITAKGSGALALGTPALSASGNVGAEGAAALAAPPLVLEGLGNAINPIAGAGDVLLPSLLLNGVGVIPISGSGDVAFTLTLDGAGTVPVITESFPGGGAIIRRRPQQLRPDRALLDTSPPPPPLPQIIKPAPPYAPPAPTFDPPVPWSPARDLEEVEPEAPRPPAISGVGAMVYTPGVVTAGGYPLTRAVAGGGVAFAPTVAGTGVTLEPMWRQADDDAEALTALLLAMRFR